MKSIGTFNSHNIPISTDEYGTLITYTTDDREIRIFYRREMPFFHVAYVAILLERTPTFESFEVFEYEYFSHNDVMVKSYIKELIETSIKHTKPKEQTNQ